MNNKIILNKRDKLYILKEHLDVLYKKQNTMILYKDGGIFEMPGNDMSQDEVIAGINETLFEVSLQITALEQIRDSMI